VYSLGVGLDWWKIRDCDTLPRTRTTKDGSVDMPGSHIALKDGSSSTITGTVWSLGCILFEFCTGQRFTTMGSGIPFHDGFDESSRKFFSELLQGMLCVDDDKRLSMDEFCSWLGGVVSLINTKFVLPQEQSASPQQFYFDPENWIGTEIKLVQHCPRIEHLVPTGIAVEENKNLLKRRKTAVNARTIMLGVDHSATRISIEIYGWTLFFQGHSKLAVQVFTRLLEGAPDNDTRRTLEAAIAWGESNLSKAAKERAFLQFTKIWDDTPEGYKDLQSYSALLGRGIIRIRAGNYDAAVKDLNTVADGLPTVLTGSNLYMSEALHVLGTAHFYSGDSTTTQENFKRAQENFKLALQIILDVEGPDHPDVFQNKQKLGEIALEKGEFGEAKELLHEALEGQKRVLGEEDPDTQETKKLLKRAARKRSGTTGGAKEGGRSIAKGTAGTNKTKKSGSKSTTKSASMCFLCWNEPPESDM